MTNKEFDDFIRRILESYEPTFDPGTWAPLENRIPEANGQFDELVRDAMSSFGAAGSSDWDDMEQILNAFEDDMFDTEVKSEVDKYEEPYDPQTWPVLNEKIEEDERRRRHLLFAKILEIAAVLFALVTFLNLWPYLRTELGEEIQAFSMGEPAGEAVVSDAVSNSTLSLQGLSAPGRTGFAESLAAVPAGSVSDNTGEIIGTSVQAVTTGRRAYTVTELPTTAKDVAHGPLVPGTSGAPVGFENAVQGQTSIATEAGTGMGQMAYAGAVEPLPSTEARMSSFVFSGKRKLIKPDLYPHGLRFTLLASVDINSLYIPPDQFFADGEPIHFESRDLLASGYSSGLGVLLDRGPWSFETGLTYSVKRYEPNRILKIGKTFDISTIDFKQIDLHTIHIPANAHWNFDRKGKTRFYATGGAGLNIVATANYDLLVENEYRNSIPAGSRPSNPTNYQAQVVRENLLDGAEFRSKSYLTLQLGMGMDYLLDEKFSLFVQPTYYHQVPFFRISDLNGKRLHFASLMFGTRVRIK